MKLKLYHVFIFVGLSLALALDLTFIGLTIYHFLTVGSKISDGIIYMICFTMLLAFIILEIVNTAMSLKTGSNFIKRLLYDDDNQLVRAVFVVASIMAAISAFIIVYSILLICGYNLPFSTLDDPMMYVTIAFGFTILIDAFTFILFPSLAQDDISFNEKLANKRRKRMF